MKKNVLIFFVIFGGICSAQNFEVEIISGTAKFQSASSETWIDLKPGDQISLNSTVATGENSSVRIIGNGKKFHLKESSALTLSNLKTMTQDELLLALAMDEILDAPKKKDKSKSSSTAVYGTKINSKENLLIISDDYGIKRLNGAVQLADNGYKESALIAAKETFRKYPSTKEIASFRIYFAEILIEKKLYDEAYSEFSSIKELDLNTDEKNKVDDRLKLISGKISAQ
jgi:hypothetical protein